MGYGHIDPYLKTVGADFTHGVNFASSGSRACNSSISGDGSDNSGLFSLSVQVDQFRVFRREALSMYQKKKRSKSPFISCLSFFLCYLYGMWWIFILIFYLKVPKLQIWPLIRLSTNFLFLRFWTIQCMFVGLKICMGFYHHHGDFQMECTSSRLATMTLPRLRITHMRPWVYWC